MDLRCSNIANIVIFCRNSEPRFETDLFENFRKQADHWISEGFSITVLLEYDALIDLRYKEYIENNINKIETGAWLEVVKPLCEDAGIKWRGRENFSWDWFANVGFTVGYAPEERLKLADAYMKRYLSIFGEYPETVGCWIIDAVTLKYLETEYRIKTACFCRDQWGTDGYNLWGGYYGQAYYPSVNNSFCPAQSRKNQINIPVFRMLGPDPVHQYDAGLNKDGDLSVCDSQPCITMEPVISDAGGNPDWVKWFFDCLTGYNPLNFGYVQIGQENSFSWKDAENGVKVQSKMLKKYISEGKIVCETLGETGKKFREIYAITPESDIYYPNDFINGNTGSYWFCSRFYRINVYWENGTVRIRDIFLFDDSREERYLKTPCKTTGLLYDNLPVVDGYRQSGNQIRAGWYPKIGGEYFRSRKYSVRKRKDGVHLLLSDGQNNFTFIFKEQKVEILCNKDFILERLCCCEDYGKLTAGDQIWNFSFDNRDYSVLVENGKIEGTYGIVSNEGNVSIKFSSGTENAGVYYE